MPPHPTSTPSLYIQDSDHRFPDATYHHSPSCSKPSPAPEPCARHRPARTSLRSPCQTHWIASSFLQTTLAAVADPPLQWHQYPYFSFYRKHLASPLLRKAEAPPRVGTLAALLPEESRSGSAAASPQVPGGSVAGGKLSARSSARSPAWARVATARRAVGTPAQGRAVLAWA